MAFINYKERTVTANQIEGLLEIEFPYDSRLVELVRTLPDRKWNKSRSLWTTPLSEFHARKVIETLTPHDFDFDARVHRLADDKKKVSNAYFINRDGLFPFQSEAVDFIHKQGGRVILADEMGLGKTVEALAWVRERPDLRKILIVCPASVVYKWEREIKKWVGEDESIGVVTTGSQKIPDTRFYLMSYAIMVAQQQELRLVEWDLIILDEAHKIKSKDSQRSRSAMSLSYRYAILLTGTPLLNRPIELFPLLKYLNPGEWTDMFRYAMRYCDAHKNYFGWDFTGASNLPELRERIKTYMIRRTKKEVLDQLPDLTRTRLPVKVKREEIKQALEELQVWVKENGGDKGARGETLVRLAKLRQAIGIAKVPVAVEIVEDILEQSESQKVVIYAVHHVVVDMLEQALKKWGVSTITGEVSQQDRQKRIDAFQNRHSPRVMVISSAGGEGIDLFRADRLIFVEREWQPGTEEQAEARCHRMGQKNAVEAIYLIASDTVDCKMDMLIESKREVIGNLIKMDLIETHSNNTVDEFIKMIKEDK